MASRTILIGFASALSAPEVLWSLVDSGFEVIAFARRGKNAAIRSSRHVQVVDITDPADSGHRACRDLVELLENLTLPILMPLDDTSLWLSREVAHCVTVSVAGATGARVEFALDKRLQIRAALEAGFSVPRTEEINQLADLEGLDRFPCILKPALAANGIGGRVGKGSHHGIGDKEELKHLLAGAELEIPHLLQPMLVGVGEGLFGLADGEKVTCWSGHQRVRMMNPAGSGSSACRSFQHQQVLKNAAQQMLAKANWRGIFMIEILRDETGRPWFMELNGRAWGSMALARRSGLEYPSWAVRSVLTPDFRPDAPDKPPIIECRHLGRELIHVAMVLRGPPSRAFERWPSRLRTLREVLRIARGTAWYSWRPDDKKVFIAETWQTLRSHFVSSARNRIPLLDRLITWLPRPRNS